MIVLCIHPCLQLLQVVYFFKEGIAYLLVTKRGGVIVHGLAERPLKVNFVVLLVSLVHAVIDHSELAVKIVVLKIDELIFYISDGHETSEFAHHLIVWATINHIWILVGKGRLCESQRLVQIHLVF